jgi:2-isopropylmalate synthase
MHADAVHKNSNAYEFISPEAVGNNRTFLMSEVAGRSALLQMVKKIAPQITRESKETTIILDKLKELEYEGYQYEGAESSFELVVRRLLGKHTAFFELKEFKVIVNEPTLTNVNSSAIVKISVDNIEEITASEGDGPVNALDKALRKALEKFYPQISTFKLTDYKVRVLDSASATAAKVRVLIESSDGKSIWTTVGVSTDIIDASWKALVDSFEYKLLNP